MSFQDCSALKVELQAITADLNALKYLRLHAPQDDDVYFSNLIRQHVTYIKDIKRNIKARIQDEEVQLAYLQTLLDKSSSDDYLDFANVVRAQTLKVKALKSRKLS